MKVRGNIAIERLLTILFLTKLYTRNWHKHEGHSEVHALR